MIGRRGFLKMFGAGVVGLAIGLRTPEALKPAASVCVDFQWSDVEAALTLDDEIRDRYLRPAAATIAADWDTRAAAALFGVVRRE